MFQQSRHNSREGTLASFKEHVGEKAKLAFFAAFIAFPTCKANTYYKADPSHHLAYIAETEKKRLFSQPWL